MQINLDHHIFQKIISYLAQVFIRIILTISNLWVLKTTKGPRILICVHSVTKNIVETYISDGLGNINKTNTFFIDPGAKTEILINKLDIVGNNLLLNFIYRENRTGLNESPLWSSWIMIKGEDIGILTTNKDVSLSSESILKISPNPTSDILTIEFDNVTSGKLQIYNEIGHLISSKDLYDVKNYNYNVSELVDGKYHIKFIDDNKIYNAQFIKVK